MYVVCTLTIDKIYYNVSMMQSPDKIDLAIKYYLLEGFICGTLAYLLSIPLMWAIERNSDFSHFRKTMGWKVLFVFIGVQVAYTLALWPILSWVYMSMRGKPIHVTAVMKVTNMPYFAAMYLIWIFVIITIKLVAYLNEVKISRLQLESSLKESQLNTLKGQINPHFMFNSLNNIRGLILEDTTRARDMITRLSEMLRYSLTKNGVTTISLKEELQTVDNYIEISKIQFEERLQFSPHVNPETLNIAIPPMIIQMLVENAVKHGIGKLKQGGEIHLIVDIKEDKLYIEVRNSGTLSMEEGSTRLGLENIKKRLYIIFGDKATFTLREKDNFVEACITIPMA